MSGVRISQRPLLRNPRLLRKSIRFLKDEVKILVAADIDDGVLDNRASHKQVLIKGSALNHFEKESFDLIICDYVMEHLDNVKDFKKNIDFLLKKGGAIVLMA